MSNQVAVFLLCRTSWLMDLLVFLSVICMEYAVSSRGQVCLSLHFTMPLICQSLHTGCEWSGLYVQVEVQLSHLVVSNLVYYLLSIRPQIVETTSSAYLYQVAIAFSALCHEHVWGVGMQQKLPL